MIRVIVLSLLLAGCATTGQPKVVIKEVRVPVSVPCKVTQPAQPSYATESVDLASPLFDLVKSLLVELDQRRAETVELRAANKACS